MGAGPSPCPKRSRLTANDLRDEGPSNDHPVKHHRLGDRSDATSLGQGAPFEESPGEHLKIVDDVLPSAPFEVLRNAFLDSPPNEALEFPRDEVLGLPRIEFPEANGDHPHHAKV